MIASMSHRDPTETEPLGGAGEFFAFQRFRAVVVTGPDRGREAVATGAELSIGTSPQNHLVLTDPTASRHHCVIEAVPRGLRLRDLGSTNGTRLGEHWVEAIHLGGAALIGLGTTCVQLDVLDETVREPLGPEPGLEGVLGRSTAMRRITALIPLLAGSEATVLIDGETGTGKTLLAEAIHRAGPRAAGPFVVVDCAAIAPTLIESELFGHERGAFTGAHAARAGAFEAARGGTIFLDEVGELPLDLQPRLLRVLENRRMRRVGGSEPIDLDVRVIAATNRDLRALVNAGTFRSDLFYRLDVARMHVPPLRERVEDIGLLAAHFHRQFSGTDAPPPPALVAALERQRWHGNVRELRAAIERIVLLRDPGAAFDGAGAAPLAMPDLPVDLGVPFRVAKQHLIDHWERTYLVELLRQSGGSITRAGRRARMDRNYLRERLLRLGIPVRPADD